MREAVELVISKQDSQGRWKLESTYNGRFLVNIEQKGRPSKWVVLNALRALKISTIINEQDCKSDLQCHLQAIFQVTKKD
jgi:hypothetical protein